MIKNKKCNKCSLILTKDNTYKSIWKTKNYTCIECCRIYKKKINIKLRGLGYRKKSLKFRYGLTLEDFEKLYNKQNGKCFICKKDILRLGRGTNIDHNHKTGKVRGVLCSGCNTFVGFVENKAELLPIIKTYLEHDKG